MYRPSCVAILKVNKQSGRCSDICPTGTFPGKREEL
jgi:hypothetical protein